MEFTRTSPIQMNIIPIPGSVLNTKFTIKGSRNIIKINICIYIHFKNPNYKNMIDVISSDMLSLYTCPYDKAYKAQIKIPQFKDHTQAYIIFSVDNNEDLYKKVFIENLENNILPQKIDKITTDNIITDNTILDKIITDNIITDKTTIEEVPIPKDPTIEEMINLMISQYHRDLPKDSRKRITYIYPLYNKDSFHIVASNHIKYLRYKYIIENKYVEIEEVDWSQLMNINWKEKRNVLIHPFLYPFASTETFKENSRNFAKLLATKNKIGGFDVADSSRISRLAVDIVNRIDLMMVPSNFAKDAYINSGVTIPVEILPHGIPDEFLNDKTVNTNNFEIISLRKMRDSGYIFILYFMLHSDYRKGSDIVKKVMKKIQNKFHNVYLVIKSNNRSYFSDLRTINISSWIDNNDLRLLYDTCDICLSPSRGGGFELNALEAVSRGLPTLVPNGCCFLDLIEHYIPINLSNKVSQPLPGNPIHIGYGCEADINDFEVKLIDVINRLDYWKEHFRENSINIGKKYSWKNTADILDNHLKNYGFIN